MIFHNLYSASEHAVPLSQSADKRGWAFAAGQTPTSLGKPDSPLFGGFAGKEALAMENLQTVLSEIGHVLNDVLRCGCCLTSFAREDADFRTAHTGFFASIRLAARAKVSVSAVDKLVETECMARPRHTACKA